MGNKQPIIPFLTVGATAAFINLVAFTLFWKMVHFDYSISISIAFVLSVAFHFTANRYFTFKSQATRVSSQFPRYAAMVLANYAITMVIMHLVVENLHFSPWLGIFISIATTVGISYSLSRYWVFTPD